MNKKALAFSCQVMLNVPSPDNKTADAERLKNKLEELGLHDVSIPLHILKNLPEELRKNRFGVKLVVGRKKHGYEVQDFGRDNVYGLAIDIGSSNIACSLFNLDSGEKADTLARENSQVKFGSDVLSRVQRSMLGESALLAEELLSCVNELIGSICRNNNVSPDDIFAITVAGNTIMSHFFLGLDPRNISVSPYIPAVNSAVFLYAGDAGVYVNKNAVIYVFPNAGSYVGGDIVSGILFCGIYREEEPVLFIDVGTNAEITLGCRDWIMVGAGAAGPALEDGIAGIGKRAADGTISGVRIDRGTKDISLEVISGIEPVGICGSGMTDLVSELFSSGIIDQAGEFIESAKGVTDRDGEKAYMLFGSEDRKLLVSQREIKNFLLSKAAMFAFLYVFVRSVGLTFSDLKKIYIAGALGCGINLEHAVNIGMLPDLPKERFMPVGNSSLGGAERLLLDESLLHEIENIMPMITYREMNEDPDLMNALRGALFIPHTEPSMLKE